MTGQPLRIAMWSGPRNISTAMMRSWGNRRDTVVVDEPFYAFYLKQTRRLHPGADEVIARGETDWQKVVAHLTGPIPNGARVFYQKQMTHHLLPEISRDWLTGVANCFLIRDPAEVITSYAKKHGDPALGDLGFVQQLEIFNFVRERSLRVPPVIDARDVLENPEHMLRVLCAALQIDFDPAMLTWPAGLRETDGIWAKYWYDEVANSTSFRQYVPTSHVLPHRLREVGERCRQCYEQLREQRLH